MTGVALPAEETVTIIIIIIIKTDKETRKLQSAPGKDAPGRKTETQGSSADWAGVRFRNKGAGEGQPRKGAMSPESNQEPGGRPCQAEGGPTPQDGPYQAGRGTGR